MRKVWRILLIFIAVIALGYVGLNIFVSQKIKSLLSEEVGNGNIAYANYHFNWLSASFKLDSVTFIADENVISASSIKVNKLNYSDYVFDGVLSVDAIQINYPEVSLWKTTAKKQDSLPKNNGNENQMIKIGQIKLKQGNLSYSIDSTEVLTLQKYDVQFDDVVIDVENKSNKIPFSYQTIEVNGGKLNYILSSLQTLTLDSLMIDEKAIDIHQLQIKPNYSKANYVKVLTYEMDLMDISFHRVNFSDYRFDTQEKIGFSASLLSMDSIQADIHRNKLVADDLTKKKMYSQMLRDLPFDLSIDTLKLSQVDLTYEEVQEKTGETGSIFFKEMEVEAHHISNHPAGNDDFPETKFDIKTQFMGKSPLSVQWRFHVNNPDDSFRITGAGHNISPQQLNSFFVPAFNMKAEGDPIQDLYFDFYGNKYTANGNFKMVYDNVKIKVLKNDNKKSVNKLVTFVANLFVKSENKARENDVEVEKVERDPTKSFWNYFWNCIMEGLKKTVI